MNDFPYTYAITSCNDCLLVIFIFILTKDFFSSCIERI